MIDLESVPSWLRDVLTSWLGRLAERLANLQVQIRQGIIEVVGRVTAETVEVAMHTLFPIECRSTAWNQAALTSSWEDRGFDPYACEDLYEEDTLIAGRLSPPSRWKSWRPALVAGLHALSFWVRLSPFGPAMTAVAIIVGALLLLVD